MASKLQLHFDPVPDRIEVNTAANKDLSIDGIPDLENTYPEFLWFVFVF